MYVEAWHLGELSATAECVTDVTGLVSRALVEADKPPARQLAEQGQHETIDFRTKLANLETDSCERLCAGR